MKSETQEKKTKTVGKEEEEIEDNNKPLVILGSVFVENLKQAIDFDAVVKATLKDSNKISSVFLHHLAIIHLDISSGNIFLDPNFKPMVGEVEISKLLDPSHDTASISAVAGSFGYIAPEDFGEGCRYSLSKSGLREPRYPHETLETLEQISRMPKLSHSVLSYGWRERIASAQLPCRSDKSLFEEASPFPVWPA
ncbi:leucine-rich repeat receptor-like tyrosine-protein kinase PXC3 [Tanacetum coccineum]